MNAPTICWQKGCVKLIDQTKLPGKLEYIYCRDVKTLWQAIKVLSVRGAPALGVAAGFGVLLGMKDFEGKDTQKFIKHVHKVCDYIGTSRPTAVNLFNVLGQMKAVLEQNSDLSVKDLKEHLKQEALKVYEDDRKVCRTMGNYGATLIKSGANIMTICNAGALATVDYGTALGVMYAAKEKDKKFKVYACETRPLLQGARLTTWELLRAKIDATLICDSMAASVMRDKNISAIFTGADRIASNGDAANKIGTYSLAVLAKYHKIPFYVVAPFSTFDMEAKSILDIPIEERDKSEVMNFGNTATAPKNVKVFNPAFDVTEGKLITGIVTEEGIIRAPFKVNIRKVFAKYV
ncbi:Methylthioribose-1-phosphate isomerase [hydrothermal vent metagenome]|uniref:Methylthioribose-1-phosphate isomerase n=1 Tax=hydrothermal vent metagenome TaxID=652676 RepID=A0A3B1D4E7_9ZZZZ